MDRNVTTLSTNEANNVDNIEGFLYVPSLSSDDPCLNTSAQYIPQNVTRLPDVRGLMSDVIALVPWMSQECTLSYLTAAGKDGAIAFITYVPNNQTGKPPLVSDQQWSLNDGGRWKSASHYPVYAIPGAFGFAAMQQLAQYSGNMSALPNNAQILQSGADPTDLIRMFCNLETNAKAGLPSLWAFLLIVLAIVLFLVACVSFAMHWYQRYARNQLRRRIVEGEVDLESLGVSRLTVPQEVVDGFPTYIYTNSDEERTKSGTAAAVPSPRCNSPSAHLPGEATDQAHNAPHRKQTFHQPTCTICLDDFEPQSTNVRELPCHHIFHPECIAQFLLEYSSLCPTCKTKVLPIGYCPQVITSLMVRRERQMRQSARQRSAAVSPAVASPQAQQAPARPLSVGGRMASFHRQFGYHGLSFAGRRITSGPLASNSTELAVRRPPVPTVNANGAAAPASPSQVVGDRRERARRRVSALLGHQTMIEDEETERQNLPQCKIIVCVLSEGLLT